MADPFASASTLALANSNAELAQQLAELRERLPAAPVTRLSRTAFDALPANERMDFAKRGGVLFDAPPPPKPAPKPGSVSRAEFDSWSVDKRHGHIRAGHAIHD